MTPKGPSHYELKKLPTTDEHSVLIPCSPSAFGDFIAGLLGRPKTIRKIIPGPFELSKDNIDSTFHLVEQRIHQQNDAKLIQFSVKMMYNDGSSILLNSYQDFTTYAEVRPLLNTAVHLSWTYLIKFRDKDHPEKQEIDMSFIIRSDGSDVIHHQTDEDNSFITGYFSSYAFMSIEVKHTARTWGLDIDSLLTGHAKTLRASESRIRELPHKYHTFIGTCTGLAFLLAGGIGAVTWTQRFIDEQQRVARSIIGNNSTDIVGLNNRIDFLITYASAEPWVVAVISMATYTAILIAISISIILIATEHLAQPRPSFILLTKKSQDVRNEIMRRRESAWTNPIVAMAISIAGGILSNIIFSFIFARLAPLRS